MTAKQENNSIGFDPLAWMNEESEDTEVADVQTKTEVVEEKKQTLEEDDAKDVSKETINVETESSADELAVEQTEQVTEDSKITLDATLNIQNVSQLYEQIHSVLQNQNQIEIDASSVVSIDTSTLQLLIVLKQTAIKLQKQIIIDFPSDNFIAAAELLGLSEMLEVDQAAAGLF